MLTNLEQFYNNLIQLHREEFSHTTFGVFISNLFRWCSNHYTKKEIFNADAETWNKWINQYGELWRSIND